VLHINLAKPIESTGARVHPVGRRDEIMYPQSLGELCLSVFDKEILSWESWYRYWPGCYLGKPKFTHSGQFFIYAYGNGAKRKYLTCSLNDIHDLRRALYHRRDHSAGDHIT
jgi:hypothetical protein